MLQTSEYVLLRSRRCFPASVDEAQYPRGPSIYLRLIFGSRQDCQFCEALEGVLGVDVQVMLAGMRERLSRDLLGLAVSAQRDQVRRHIIESNGDPSWLVERSHGCKLIVSILKRQLCIARAMLNISEVVQRPCQVDRRVQGFIALKCFGNVNARRFRVTVLSADSG